MFKYLSLAVAVSAALALSACSNVVSGINSVTGALSSPQANQAAANVKAFTTGFVCGVGSLSALAQNVEATLQTQLQKGNAQVDKATGVVYTISTSVCAALGGTIGSSTVTVPATASTSL